MHRIAIACALLLTGCTSTPAPQSLDKMAMAHRLAELNNTPEYWRAYAQSYADTAIGQLPDFNDFCETAVDVLGCEALGAKATDEVKTALDAYVYRIESLLPGLIEDDAVSSAEIYTAEELGAMLDFYDSPMGRSMQKKGPAMTKAVMDRQYRRLTPWASEMTTLYQLIYDRYGLMFEPFFTGSTTDN